MINLAKFLPIFLTALPLMCGLLCFSIPRGNKICSILYTLYSLISISVLFSVFLKLRMHHGEGFISYTPNSLPARFGIELKIIPSLMLFLIAVSMSSVLHALSTFYFPVKNYVIGLFLTLIAGVNGIIITNDLFNSYVFFEIISITSIVLYISNMNFKLLRNIFEYLILSGISGVFILLTIFLLYQVTHQLNITEINKYIINFNDNMAIKCAYILFILSMLIKVGVFPMQSFVAEIYKKTQPHFMILLSILSSVYWIFVIKFIQNIFGFDFIQQFKFLGFFMKLAGIMGMIFYSVKIAKEDNISNFISYILIVYNSFYLFYLPYLHIYDIYHGVCLMLISNIILKSILFVIFAIITRNFAFNSVSINNIATLIVDNKTIQKLFFLCFFLISGLPFSLPFISKISVLTGMFVNYNSLIFIFFIFIFIITIMFACLRWVISSLNENNVNAKSIKLDSYQYKVIYITLYIYSIILFTSPLFLRSALIFK